MDTINFNSALITGGAGFIGSYIAEKLIESGIRVKVLDNLVTGTKKNLEHCWNKKNFEFFFL
jgi:nucleoside-diphosphate-sugar epimerase